MNIYTSEKAFSYVYLLDNPVTGEIYIGYREANELPSYLDLPEYRTSSKYVEPRFEEFNWTIVAEFFHGEDAYDFEQLTIYENWDNPLILNKHHYYGKKRWKSAKHASDETKLKMSASAKGKPKSDEAKANMSKAAKNKPPTSSETKLKMSVAQTGSKRSDETKAKQSAANKGKKPSTESIRKRKDTLEERGIINPAKIPFLSMLHNQKTYGKNSISRHFPDLKQYF